MPSSFYGIGVGPGDSELLTVKAVKVLKQLDVLYTPQAHRNGMSVAQRIAEPYLPANLTVKRRHFPMVTDPQVKETAWQKIADEVELDVKNGQNVGFLTLGDPSVYSTFSYIADRVRDAIPVKTIAGISSFSQIAASLSIPLMLDEESLEVIPATASAEQLGQVIDLNNNVVIMKIATHFAKVYRLLAKRNLLDRTLVVENASMATEKISKLSNYSIHDHLPYFSTGFLKKEGNIQ